MSKKAIALSCVFLFFGAFVFAGEGGSSSALLQPNPGLAIWTIITFVFLLLVLKKFAWGPLIQQLEKRSQYIENKIKEAEEKHQKALELMEEYQKKVELAKQEAMQIVEEGKQDAEKVRQKITDQAKKEAENLKSQAQKEIELATKQAKEELWSLAVQLSTQLAEKILERTLSSEEDKKLIGKVLEEYQKN
ncbi:MAG: ATP synthase F0 subunit B [Planctomycetota bacterium]|nr:MAG: ATP synthase F0 subunit B [Planctomycetota bacterium]